MLFNLKDKVIFISVPKTASTAVENYILEHSNDYLRNFIIKNKKIKVKTHCTVKFLHNILGDDFNNYKIIAIARNPLDCVISKYFFYRKGRPNSKIYLYIKKFHLINLLKVFLAHFLNFNIWCLPYIFRVNIPYLLINNKLPKNIVVIDFKEFQKQPTKLFDLFPNLCFNSKHFLYKNKTAYNLSEITIWKLTKLILSFKLRKEMDFYKLITNNTSEKI